MNPIIIGIGIKIKPTVLVSGPNGSPSGLGLTIVDETQIDLAWTRGSTNEDGVHIERSTDGINYSIIDTLGAGVTNYSDVSCVANFYYYRVVNFRGSSYSAYSNVANNLTPLCLYSSDSALWFDSQDLTTITKDGLQRVSAWNSVNPAGADLSQVNPAFQPIWDNVGIEFNTQFLESAFVYAPHTAFIYAVLKFPVDPAWTYPWDNTTSSGNGFIISSWGAPPDLRAYGGAWSPPNNNLALDTYGIMRIFFDGVSSKFQINNTAAITGNFGNAAWLNGFTLGASPATPSYTRIKIKEFIFRSTNAGETDIYNYLSNKYSI